MKNKLELMFARKNIVESAAEGLKNNYIKKTTEVRNSFSSDFYCLCSEFSYVDAVSCFAEVNCISNIFYRNLHVMDRVSWERFYKIFAIYNTIMFCRKNRKKLNINFIKWDVISSKSLNMIPLILCIQNILKNVTIGFPGGVIREMGLKKDF